MAEATTNQTGNVSVGKGADGAYAWIAPYGTALPTDNTSAPGAGFRVLGFIDENGVTFSDSSNSTTHNDMSGNAIATSSGAVSKTASMTWVELKKATLDLVYGADNVTDADGVIDYVDKGPDSTLWSIVYDFLLDGGRKYRVIVPQCKLGELGDMTVNYQTLIGRQTTMNVLYDPDVEGYYHGIVDSTETSASEG